MTPTRPIFPFQVGTTTRDVVHMEIKDLLVNSSWNFRITAVNAAGVSDPFAPEDTITAGKRISKFYKPSNKNPSSSSSSFVPLVYSCCSLLRPGAPSAPRKFMSTDVTSRCVTLQWIQPENNGGSEITGYVLERKESNEESWTKVVTLDPTVLQYTVENLREKSNFYFRIFAENAVGLSSPATTNLINLKTHASECRFLRLTFSLSFYWTEPFVFFPHSRTFATDRSIRNPKHSSQQYYYRMGHT